MSCIKRELLLVFMFFIYIFVGIRSVYLLTWVVEVGVVCLYIPGSSCSDSVVLGVACVLVVSLVLLCLGNTG